MFFKQACGKYLIRNTDKRALEILLSFHLPMWALVVSARRLEISYTFQTRKECTFENLVTLLWGSINKLQHSGQLVNQFCDKKSNFFAVFLRTDSYSHLLWIFVDYIPKQDSPLKGFFIYGFFRTRPNEQFFDIRTEKWGEVWERLKTEVFKFPHSFTRRQWMSCRRSKQVGRAPQSLATKRKLSTQIITINSLISKIWLFVKNSLHSVILNFKAPSPGYICWLTISRIQVSSPYFHIKSNSISY